jgi:hypothetical protein
MKYVKLAAVNRVLEMPAVGLGTWRAQPEEMEKAVWAALEAGYRHIGECAHVSEPRSRLLADTAFNYNTEETIGKVLSRWFSQGKGKREDLFVTTKLPNCGNRAGDVARFLKMSLEKLQLTYVDLYLIHMPFSFRCNEASFAPLTNEDGSFSLDVDSDIICTWQVMIYRRTCEMLTDGFRPWRSRSRAAWPGRSDSPTSTASRSRGSTIRLRSSRRCCKSSCTRTSNRRTCGPSARNSTSR